MQLHVFLGLQYAVYGGDVFRSLSPLFSVRAFRPVVF